jgi:hypothetical protein
VRGKYLRQFSLPRAPQILEQLWPRLQTSALDDLLKRSAEVGAGAATHRDRTPADFIEDLLMMVYMSFLLPMYCLPPGFPAK